MPAGTPDTSLPAPVRAAVQVAARELGVDPSAVEVVEYSEEEWSDASLGCPKPGMFYAQVITPGYRVLLRVAGQELEYHTDRHGTVVRC